MNLILMTKFKEILGFQIPNTTMARVGFSFLWLGLVGEYVSTHPLTIWVGFQELGAFIIGLSIVWLKKKEQERGII